MSVATPTGLQIAHVAPAVWWIYDGDVHVATAMTKEHAYRMAASPDLWLALVKSDAVVAAALEIGERQGQPADLLARLRSVVQQNDAAMRKASGL